MTVAFDRIRNGRPEVETVDMVIPVSPAPAGAATMPSKRPATGTREHRRPGHHVLDEVADGPVLAGHGGVEVLGGERDELLVRRRRDGDEVRAGGEVSEHVAGR